MEGGRITGWSLREMKCGASEGSWKGEGSTPAGYRPGRTPSRIGSLEAPRVSSLCPGSSRLSPAVPLRSPLTRRRRRRALRTLEVSAPETALGFGPDDRLYFLHIHKTAGSTLARILETHFGQGQICPPQTWQQFLTLPRTDLAQYRLFRGHLLAFSQWLPTRPWIVTFLRDPVERTLSTYDYIRRNDRHRLHRSAMTMDLETFLHDPDTTGTVRDLQTRWILANALPCDSLKDMEAQVAELGLDPLTTARRQLDSYAFVGLVERFDASVQRLMDVLGWPLFDWMTEHSGDRVNVSEDRVRREDLSSGVLDRILELTSLDRALHETALAHFDATSPTPSRVDRSPFSADPTDIIDLDFSGPVPGFGWQMPETHPVTGAGFRWIGPRPEASLFLPLRRDRELEVALTVQKAITAEVLADLSLHIGTAEVALRAEGDGEPPLVLRGRLPASTTTADGATRLSFSVGSTTSPAALGRAPDRRQLGVAFSRLELRPAR